jgi:hypothetical protein
MPRKIASAETIVRATSQPFVRFSRHCGDDAKLEANESDLAPV